LVFGKGLAWLRGAWANGTVTPLLCTATVFELIDALAYEKFKLPAARRADLFQDYLPFGEVLTLPETLPDLPVTCRDVDDALFLHLTVFGQADFLVTGDADLLVLAAAFPVPIIRPSALRPLL
jgi:putative PIN family toxin of toxin-antitoxin system